jgi:hypothetical protein
MAKKYSSVRPKNHVAIRPREAHCSLESAYVPGIVLTVSVASIFSAINLRSYESVCRKSPVQTCWSEALCVQVWILNSLMSPSAPG